MHVVINFHCVCVFSEGEEWQAVRSLLGKHMLRPKAVEAYDKTLNSVVSDLITKLRLSTRPQGLVTDIASEFYRFGLEGKVSCTAMHPCGMWHMAWTLVIRVKRMQDALLKQTKCLQSNTVSVSDCFRIYGMEPTHINHRLLNTDQLMLQIIFQKKAHGVYIRQNKIFNLGAPKHVNS